MKIPSKLLRRYAIPFLATTAMILFWLDFNTRLPDWWLFVFFAICFGHAIYLLSFLIIPLKTKEIKNEQM